MLAETNIAELSAQEPGWFKEKRYEAFKVFEKREMPQLRYGLGIFMDISDIDLSSFSLAATQKDKVEVPEGVEVMSLAEAFVTHESLVKQHLFSQFTFSENKLTALHAAFLNSGLFIRIPKNVEVAQPIRLNLEAENMKLEHVLIVAEPGSKATVIENITSTTTGYRSQVVEIVVEEAAHFEYRTLQHLNDEIFNFSRRFGDVGRDASLHWVDCYIGGKLSQSFTRTYLTGEGADSTTSGILFGDASQRFDIACDTVHVASNTTSDMLTRVVLAGKAKAIYRGLVNIKPGARNCQGYQKDDTILLSDFAKADVVPNLEISNNDVKCSHGATISQIDEDKLFYMMSRGLNPITAKKAIVEGFFEPILLKMEDAALHKVVLASVSDRLRSLE